MTKQAKQFETDEVSAIVDKLVEDTSYYWELVLHNQLTDKWFGVGFTLLDLAALLKTLPDAPKSFTEEHWRRAAALVIVSIMEPELLAGGRASPAVLGAIVGKFGKETIGEAAIEALKSQVDLFDGVKKKMAALKTNSTSPKSPSLQRQLALMMLDKLREKPEYVWQAHVDHLNSETGVTTEYLVSFTLLDMVEIVKTIVPDLGPGSGDETITMDKRYRRLAATVLLSIADPELLGALTEFGPGVPNEKLTELLVKRHGQEVKG